MACCRWKDPAPVQIRSCLVQARVCVQAKPHERKRQNLPVVPTHSFQVCLISCFSEDVNLSLMCFRVSSPINLVFMASIASSMFSICALAWSRSFWRAESVMLGCMRRSASSLRSYMTCEYLVLRFLNAAGRRILNVLFHW